MRLNTKRIRYLSWELTLQLPYWLDEDGIEKGIEDRNEKGIDHRDENGEWDEDGDGIT